MSTNYYLKRLPDECEECGHVRNWPVRIHIGKSSGGWVFLWRGWDGTEPDGPGVPLETPDAWFAYLAEEIAKDAVIVAEYGMEYSLADFRTFVESKRTEPRRNSRIKESDVAHVDGDDVAFHEFC